MLRAGMEMTKNKTYEMTVESQWYKAFFFKLPAILLAKFFFPFFVAKGI